MRVPRTAAREEQLRAIRLGVLRGRRALSAVAVIAASCAATQGACGGVTSAPPAERCLEPRVVAIEGRGATPLGGCGGATLWHPIRPEACESDDDCPAGLVCEEAGATMSGAPPSGCPASNGCDPLPWCEAGASGGGGPGCGFTGGSGRRCVVPDARQVNEDVLIAGFAAEELHLVDAVGAAPIAWTPPDGTRFVTCAVFRCTPTVDPGDAERAASITNLPQCAIAIQELPGPDGEFDPRATDTELLDFDGCAKDQCAVRPVGTLLVAGCWAYDDTHVIAASRLRPLSLAAAPDGAVVIGCEGADGHACALGADASLAAGIGVCVGRSCLRWCVSDLDCKGANANGGAGGAGTGDGGRGGHGGQGGGEATTQCVRRIPSTYAGQCVEAG